MATGKISVELVLELAKFNAQLKTAVAGMGKATNVGVASSGVDKASKSMTILQSATRKVKNEVDGLQKALGSVATQFKTKAYYEAMKPKPFDFNDRTIPGADPSGKPWSFSETDESQKPITVGLSKGKPIEGQSTTGRTQAPIGAVPPAMFPISKRPAAPPPPIPLMAMLKGGNFQGTVNRVTSGGLASPLAIAAQLGAALAGLRVAVGLVQYAFRAMMVPVNMLRRAFVEAAESARRLYARALQSGGLGLGFIAHRKALADTIGVSEEEVYNFGGAVKYLSDSLRFSSSVMAATNQELTSAAWSLQVVNHDLKALVALLMVSLAPIVRELVSAMHGIAMLLSSEAVLWGKLIAAGIKAGMSTVLGPVWSLAMLGLEKLGGVNKGPAPGMDVSTNRMPASAWEKMGLVIGTGGGNDWAQQTARNTKQMAEKLGKMVELMGVGAGMSPFQHLANAQ